MSGWDDAYRRYLADEGAPRVVLCPGCGGERWHGTGACSSCGAPGTVKEPHDEDCQCGHPKAHHDVLAEDPTGSKHEACMHDGICRCNGFMAADS